MREHYPTSPKAQRRSNQYFILLRFESGEEPSSLPAPESWERDPGADVSLPKDRNPQSMPAGGTRAGRAPIHDELLYPFDKGLGLRLVNITTSFCSQIRLDTLSNYSRFCKLSEWTKRRWPSSYLHVHLVQSIPLNTQLDFYASPDKGRDPIQLEEISFFPLSFENSEGFNPAQLLFLEAQ